MNNYKNSNTGFTLIELMVTIAIVGIFASIALPSFARLIESNRISTATNELATNLLFTKSEALKRSNSVTICASTDQENCNGTADYATGWVIFLDCGAIGVRNTGAIADCGENDREEVIKVHNGFDALAMTNNIANFATFNFTGRPTRISTFDVGLISEAPQKTVSVNLIGRVRTTTLP